jgi:hypothetical protein
MDGKVDIAVYRDGRGLSSVLDGGMTAIGWGGLAQDIYGACGRWGW